MVFHYFNCLHINRINLLKKLSEFPEAERSKLLANSKSAYT